MKRKIFVFYLLFLVFKERLSQIAVCENVFWFNTGINAIDLSVNAEGDLYVIGVDDRIYFYNQNVNRYTLLHADNEISEPKRIAVNDQGIPFVVENCGDIHYLSFENHWEKLEGCATDIGISKKTGDIWKLGCNKKENGGYGISKLSCTKPFKSPLINNERQYKNYKKEDDTIDFFINYELKESSIQPECRWVEIDGEGKRIAVGMKGEPYIVAPYGIVMKYESPNWVGIYGQAAIDLDISNEGVLFTVGADGNIMKSVVEEMGTWIQIEGSSGMSITVGPYSQPIVANMISGTVMTTGNLLIS